MPIYEYECLSCAYRFEEMQRFSDPPITACTECHSPVRKILFPAAVIFKGSGFYATEYGRSKANNTSTPAGETENSGKKEADKKDATTTSTPATTASGSTSNSGEKS